MGPIEIYVSDLLFTSCVSTGRATGSLPLLPMDDESLCSFRGKGHGAPVAEIGNNRATSKVSSQNGSVQSYCSSSD